METPQNWTYNKSAPKKTIQLLHVGKIHATFHSNWPSQYRQTVQSAVYINLVCVIKP